MLGAYVRDVLNKIRKLLLLFEEDNRLALLNTFFAKLDIAYLARSMRQLWHGQVHLDFTLMSYANR